jgi:hypothetical protein
VLGWIGLSCIGKHEVCGVPQRCRIAALTKRCLGLLAGNLGLSGGKGRRQAVLRVDAVDAVHGVEVLDARDLEARRAALARGDRGVGEEVFPDLEGGLLAVLWCGDK